MNINNLIDKLNKELDKLNNLKNGNIDTNSFFTDNEFYNDDFNPENYVQKDNTTNNTDSENNINQYNYENIEPNTETTSLVTIKERRILAAQTMFKKSIRISLKSFLISISLSFLNLFI